MGRRRPFSPRQRDAERQGIIATGISRAIATAEMHRDRIRVSINHAHDLIDEGRAAGRDVSTDELKLATLRVTLAGHEKTIASARRAAGLNSIV